MKLKSLISQVEYLFGRQPQSYVLQLINDCLDEYLLFQECIKNMK